MKNSIPPECLDCASNEKGASFHNANKMVYICIILEEHTKEAKNCPCKECLIKPMCRKGCDEFNMFVDRVIGEKKKRAKSK